MFYLDRINELFAVSELLDLGSSITFLPAMLTAESIYEIICNRFFILRLNEIMKCRFKILF